MMDSKKHIILLVEDSPIPQKVAKMTLMELNCDVEVADNGKKALELFREKVFDLIFLDIGLGEDMDGIEVAEKIRELEQCGAHIPIIALTAHCNKDDQARYEAAGMDDFIQKPIDLDEGRRLLDKYLQK